MLVLYFFSVATEFSVSKDLYMIAYHNINSFMNKSFNTRNVIWQNLVVFLSVNILIDATNLISGIYTNFQTFLKQLVVNHGVMKLMIPATVYSFNVIITQHY